ncbi:hypothetical protein A9W99_15000 [Mycobacterium sp. 1164966.3]|nr:hypothetical protein A9W99_15000 [Mycobacterium sp. 1164966.3]
MNAELVPPVGWNQKIRSDHVAIKPQTAIQVGHRNSEVVQPGQARTIVSIVHEPYRATDDPEVHPAMRYSLRQWFMR